MGENHFSEREFNITDILEFRIIKSVCSSYRKNDFLPCIFLCFNQFSKIFGRELFPHRRKNNFIAFFCEKFFSQYFSFCRNNLLWSSFFDRFQFSEIQRFSQSFLIFFYRFRKVFMRIRKNIKMYHTWCFFKEYIIELLIL